MFEGNIRTRGKTKLTGFPRIVWHESGKGNDNMVERLQRRATDELITKLGWGL